MLNDLGYPDPLCVETLNAGPLCRVPFNPSIRQSEKKMKKILTGWLATLGVALSLVALPTHAQQLGGDYTEIVPALVADAPDKIEVIEFSLTLALTAMNSTRF